MRRGIECADTPVDIVRGSGKMGSHCSDFIMAGMLPRPDYEGTQHSVIVTLPSSRKDRVKGQASDGMLMPTLQPSDFPS